VTAEVIITFEKIVLYASYTAQILVSPYLHPRMVFEFSIHFSLLVPIRYLSHSVAGSRAGPKKISLRNQESAPFLDTIWTMLRTTTLLPVFCLFVLPTYLYGFEYNLRIERNIKVCSRSRPFSSLPFTPLTASIPRHFTLIDVPDVRERHSYSQRLTTWRCIHVCQSQQNDDDNEEEDTTSIFKDLFEPRTYKDENFPDLEFVDYTDPNYVFDQASSIMEQPQKDNGTGDDDDDHNESVEEEIEAMREERRRLNDEYQFQTYFRDALRNGDTYYGEWTVYQTSTFLDHLSTPTDGIPTLVKSGIPLRILSSAHKSFVETTTESFPVDGERIHHREQLLNNADVNDNDEDGKGRDETKTQRMTREILSNTYSPRLLCARDFRGEQGIMCVANAFTISTAEALDGSTFTSTMSGSNYCGPYASYRSELGLHSGDVRFRLKFDYRVLPTETNIKFDNAIPPLHLKSMTVCREVLSHLIDMENVGDLQSMLNTTLSSSLFGTSGAQGGLYDPPPVGSDIRATQYMLLDLPGGATILFPYKLDQDPHNSDSSGWVSSIDWTPPGIMRYQVDRKVRSGVDLLKLRTLELSEVRSADADRYRPRDGGKDMRQ
jgi:hypothetical protein